MKDTLIITGASRGIGKATAIHFAKNKWNVVNLSRRPCSYKPVNNLTIDLTEKGWNIQHEETIKSALKGCGRICLVHNAGLLVKDSVCDMSIGTLREVLEISLIAPTILNNMIIPMMKKGSSILYIGSTLSEKAVRDTASYVTAKHGVNGLMRATCQDLHGKGIHTACICPGFTETEMLFAHLGQNQQVINTIAESMSEKRLIQPEEMAEFIFYCANSPVINGATLHAHLGQIEH